MGKRRKARQKRPDARKPSASPAPGDTAESGAWFKRTSVQILFALVSFWVGLGPGMTGIFSLAFLFAGWVLVVQALFQDPWLTNRSRGLHFTVVGSVGLLVLLGLGWVHWRTIPPPPIAAEDLATTMELYSKIPGDVDFIVRGLEVDRASGRSFRLTQPADQQDWGVLVTPMSPLSGALRRDAIQVAVGGIQGTNLMEPCYSDPIILEPGTLSRPIGMFGHQVFVFVEEVQTQYVRLAVARRRLSTGITFQRMSGCGSFWNVEEDLPEPILVPR